MDLELWYKTYAYFKWEFLRRNSDYRKDFDELAKPPYSFEDIGECIFWIIDKKVDSRKRNIFWEKWKLQFPVHYKYHFDEIPDDYIKWDLFLWAQGADPSKGLSNPVAIGNKYAFLQDLMAKKYYSLWLQWPDYPDHGTEEDWSEFIEQYRKSRTLTLDIDLGYDKKVILDNIKSWLEFIELGKRFIQPQEPTTRQRQKFDRYDQYIKVWEMRQEGLPFPEIAREIFPDDFRGPSELEEGDPEPNPDSALVKVQQYHREADRLIKSGI